MNVNRSSQHSAIVIRVSPFGEHHAFVDLLTSDTGMLPVVAYGVRSPRSALRGKVVPFARGTVWVYRDPRQERGKITDFDVEEYALTVTADLEAYYEASLWAEVVWRSHASGDAGEIVYRLIDRALRLLDQHPEQASALGTLVLWHYLDILGLQPDLEYCSRSERHLAAEEPRFYDAAEGVVVSSEWASPNMPLLEPKAAFFLARSRNTPMENAAALLTDPALRGELRRFVVAAIQEAIGVPLNTLKVSGRLRGL